ncbi:hypothetical protein TWF281_005000 [Arthrobotrys megalospora]
MHPGFLVLLYTFISIISVGYVEAQTSLQRSANIFSPNDGDVIPLGGTIVITWQNLRADRLGLALINRTFDPIITGFRVQTVENTGEFRWGVLNESDTLVRGTYTVGLSPGGPSNNLDDYELSGVFSFTSPAPSSSGVSSSRSSTSTPPPSATGNPSTSTPPTSTRGLGDSSPSGSPPSTEPSSPSQSSGLSPGAIAGTVVGSVAVFVAGALIGLWIMVRERRKRSEKASAPLIPPGPDDQPRWDDGNAYFQNPNKPTSGDGWISEAPNSTSPQELEASRSMRAR